jgi:hypothetical protein
MSSYYSLHENGWNLLTEIVIYNDKLWKFINNSYYFKFLLFLWVTSFDPKFYKPIFFWNVKSAPNYIEKLILMRIATITLLPI